MSAAALDRVARRLAGRREAFVVVEGTRGAALRAKSALVTSLAKQRDVPETSGIIAPAAPILRPLVAEDEEQ